MSPRPSPLAKVKVSGISTGGRCDLLVNNIVNNLKIDVFKLKSFDFYLPLILQKMNYYDPSCQQFLTPKSYIEENHSLSRRALQRKFGQPRVAATLTLAKGLL